MIISNFEQSKKDKITFEGEAVRLSNELRAKPARTSINDLGFRIDIPAKQGFDIETCEFMDMVNWLADTRIKKSQSLSAFVHRVMAVRFPNEYTNNKKNIDNRYNLEMELIESKSKNDVSWFGEVGFSNMVRLDGILNNNNNKVIENKDKTVKIIRK
jgi:hypothetical protein